VETQLASLPSWYYRIRRFTSALLAIVEHQHTYTHNHAELQIYTWANYGTYLNLLTGIQRHKFYGSHNFEPEQEQHSSVSYHMRQSLF
jgi:hypothetical protein